MKVTVELDLNNDSDLFKYKFLNNCDDFMHLLHHIMYELEANESLQRDEIQAIINSFQDDKELYSLYECFLVNEGFRRIAK